MKANFSWTFAGNVVNAACQWGILAILARLASPAAVGQFVFGLAVTAPVIAIAMLQLRNLLVTDAKGDFTFADYFGVRIVYTALAFAGIILYVMLSDLEIHAAIVVILVGASKCADSVSDIVRGLFQRLDRMDYCGKSLMLRGPSALFAMGLTMYLTHSLPLAVATLVGIWVITLVSYDITNAIKLLRTGEYKLVGTRFRPKITYQTLVKLSWIAFPLGVVMGIISLQTNIPRYLIKQYCDEQALGYFGALAYPMIAAMMIASAMGQSASTRLSRYFIHNLQAFRRLLGKLVLIAAILGFACIAVAYVLGKPLLTLLYGSDYAQYQHAFVLLSVATAIQLIATCAGYALTAARYIRIQTILVSISCLVALIVGIICVPRYGVDGGAMVAIATSSAMFVLFFSSIGWAMKQRKGFMTLPQTHDNTENTSEKDTISSDLSTS